MLKLLENVCEVPGTELERLCEMEKVQEDGSKKFVIIKRIIACHMQRNQLKREQMMVKNGIERNK